MYYIQSSTGKRIDLPGHRGVKYWKLRTSEAVARRKKYKANKPKKSRIRCEHCGKRHTPKRSTKLYCSDSCRVASHIQEYKIFNRFGLIAEWEALDDENKASHKRIGFLRHRLYQVIMKI